MLNASLLFETFISVIFANDFSFIFNGCFFFTLVKLDFCGGGKYLNAGILVFTPANIECAFFINSSVSFSNSTFFCALSEIVCGTK